MRTNRRFKNALALLIAVVMLLSVMSPLTAFAAITVDESKLGSNTRLTSKTDYNVVPGVTESHIITHNNDGSNQVKSFAIEVDLSNPNIGILASYKNYMNDLSTSASWGMQTVRDQAAAAEKYYREIKNDSNFKIVAGVNGDFFNMQTGAPTGSLIMNGNVYNTNTSWPYFAILSDGTAVIRDKSDSDYAAKFADAQQLVGGPNVMIKNGTILEAIKSDPNAYPRTSVGIRADGSVVFVVADGRQAPDSCGQTLLESAEQMLSLGCVYALQLDGGGSTTMISQHEGDSTYSVLNSPSDGVDRTVSTAILVYSNAAPDGQFSHANITPNNEVYTPGSSVDFTVMGADSSGAYADLPANGELTIADTSYGSITDGKFVSSGKEGTVVINYMVNGTSRGTTSIEVRSPDKIAFDNDEVSLGFEEQTDLGIRVTYQNRLINFKTGDIVWTKEVESTSEEDGSKIYVPDTDDTMGTFSGNTFITSDSNSVTGRITATSAFDNSVSATLTAVIGKLPSIVWDFENPEEYVVSHGKFVTPVDYGDDYVEGVTTHVIMTYDRGGVGEAEIIDMDGGEVRHGSRALKISYDFTNWNGVTEGVCFGPVANTKEIEGTPTALGMWVYAPEGTPNLWLRMFYKDATGTQRECNLTEERKEAADGIGGINWSGWRYVEGSLAGQAPYYFFAGGTIRLMYLKPDGDEHGFWTVTGGYEKDEDGNDTPILNKKWVEQADAKGVIYVDNVQFVYGANTDDTQNPVIDNIKVGSATGDDMQDIVSGTVVNTNEISIESSFHDVEDKYATGINFDNVRLYIDGKDVTADSFVLSGDSMVRYYTTLADGLHSVKVLVRDGFNNETSETRYFTVKGGVEYPTVRVSALTEKCLLNSDFTLAVESNDIDKVTGVNASIRLDSDIVTSEDALNIAYTDGFTGEYTYNPATGILNLSITAVGNDETEEELTALSSAWNSIATITVTIPYNTAQGKSFTYRVLEGGITFSDPSIVTTTFASAETAVTVEASYVVTADPVITETAAKFYVTDTEGTAAADVDIYNADTNEVIGTTNQYGMLRYMGFSDEVQKFSVYAMKDGAYSFKYSSQSANAACPDDGTPEHILVNASENGSTSKNIAWLSNPIATEKVSIVKYAEKSAYEANGESALVSVSGTNQLFPFLGNSDINENYIARINTVPITGLKENTEYVYRVGDGVIWSALKSFSTSLAGGTTSFFVFGDIQAEDTANITNLLTAVKNDGVDYDFGIQTGDSIETASIYSHWDEILKVFSDENIADTDLIHVLGNHEYMGDATAISSSSIYNLPNPDYYSVTYGNIYVAVINYQTDMAAALEWLRADAAASTARWKILTMHVPTYNTNASAPNKFITENLPKVAQEAGLTAVFSGHDHSYTRTSPMTDLQIDKVNGVTYFICGSSGEKSYSVTNNPAYNFEIATNDYTSIYLSVTATDTTFSVNVYDVSGDSKVLFDSWSKTVDSDCKTSGHKYVYSDGYLECSVCGARTTSEGYTGVVTDKATDLPMSLNNGEIETNKWLSYNSSVYYLGEDGLPVSGTQQIGDYTYEFDDDCTLTEYAFVRDDGTLATNQWIGLEYYLGEDGLPVTGEVTIGKYTYTFGEDGKLIKGDLVKEGGSYYYYIAGERQRGWHMIDGYWYYFDRVTGYKMATGKYTVESTDSKLVFTFSSDGKLLKGAWLTTENGTVYYWGNNERLSGWQYIDGAIYYFGDNDYMVTGVQEIGGETYTFGQDGKLQMTSDSMVIDGLYYTFDEDGNIETGHIKDHPYEKVVDEAVAPTEDSTGLTEGEHCGACGEVVVAQKVLPKVGETTTDPNPGATYILGDVDNNGKVEAADARLALRIAAQLEPEPDTRTFIAADVNMDARITASDARKILRVSAQLDKF